MALPFVPSDAAMLAVQAAVVAAPRADPPGLSWLRRLGGRWWALVPLGSIVVVIFAIRGVSDTATGLTYLALVAVPILAALALACEAHRTWIEQQVELGRKAPYTRSYRQPRRARVTSVLPRQSGMQARRTNSRGEPSSLQAVGIVFVITPA